jgi:hypothetical protein
MSLLHLKYHTQVVPHDSYTPHIVSHPHSNPLRIQLIELSYLLIIPRLAKTKKKSSEEEASGDGDGVEAILSFGVGESTSLNMQRKSPTTARTKSKVAGSKKKTSNAATSTSEEPSSPEAGGRKCPPEQLVALVKQKEKVTLLWQRGKPKRVVVSDVVVSAAATSPSTPVPGLVAAALRTKVKNKGSSSASVIVFTMPFHSLP